MTKITTRLTILNLNNSGQGMAKHPHDGRPLFFDGLWPGDEIEVELDSTPEVSPTILSQHLNAAVRQEVSCPHHGHGPEHCRGCPWLEINYQDQLNEKHRKLQFWLKRVGLDQEASELVSIIPSTLQQGYRNRAQFKTDGEVAGFVAKGIKKIIPLTNCQALNNHCQRLFSNFKGQLPSTAFRPKAGHTWNFFEIDDDMSDVSEVQLNKPRPFKQANSLMNLKMRQWLETELTPIERSLPLLELFCGDGNFTQVIAQMGFSEITAVESSEDSLARLTQKNLSGVRPILSNLYRPEGLYQISDERNDFQIMVANPSYQGFLHRDLYFKKFPRLRHFFYIACNPEKMTHDLAAMKKKGWKIVALKGMDLFPNTPHFETLAYLKKEF